METVGRMGTCQVCKEKNARYRCPACELCTCSVPCIKAHKKQLDCDGLRMRTSFVKKEDFTDADILNDYRLLEDTVQRVDTYRRDPAQRMTWHDNLPQRLFKVRNVASQRGTRLFYLPRSFSRHKENTSCVDKGKESILWHVRWIFPQADVETTDDAVPEDLLLSTALQKYVQPGRDSDMDEQLQYYQSAGLVGIKAYLQAEKVSNGRFYQLDLNATLGHNLVGKIVIEFPTITVALKDHSQAFPLVEDQVMNDSCISAELNTAGEGPSNIQGDQPLMNTSSFFSADFCDGERSTDDNFPPPPKRLALDIPYYHDLVRM